MTDLAWESLRIAHVEEISTVLHVQVTCYDHCSLAAQGVGTFPVSGKTQGKGQMQPLICPVKELARKSCEFREIRICLSMYFQMQRCGRRLVRLWGGYT